MSRSETLGPAGTHKSARLGLTLRSVLLAPTDGFAAALKATARRARTSQRPAEGIAPYVLAFLGGAALASLWLKIGALAGLREACSPRYVAASIAGALVLGGGLGLIAQALWGAVGPATIRGLHGEARGGSLRLVWGAAAFPQVIALVVLLPLDLLIVGSSTYTTGTLADPLSTAWSAFSLAIGISAAVWSLFLLVRGVEVASDISFGRAVVAAAVAVGCFVCLVALLVVGVSLATEVRACPTPRA